MGEGEYQVSGKQFTGAGADIPLCLADPRRVLLILTQTAGGAPTACVPVGVASPAPRVSLPTGTNVEFFYRRHGPLPGFAWTALAVGPGNVVNVIELIYKGPRAPAGHGEDAGDE